MQEIIKIVLLTLVCLLIFSGVGSAQGQPVRMAYLHNDIHHLALWVAQDKNYFQQENVDIEIAGAFNAGPELMSAFAAGELDMAYVGAAPATVAVANKAADVAILAGANTEGSALVAQKAADYKQLKELAGKTVAVPGHSTVQDFLLRRALKDKAIQADELDIMIQSPPEMVSALRANQIDAFVAWEPYPARAHTDCIGHNLKTSAEIWPDHPCCVLVVDKDYFKDNPQTVRAVLQAHVTATEFIQNNKEQAINTGVEHTGMDRDTVQQALQTVEFTPLLNKEAQTEYVEFLNELGYIDVDDARAFVDRLIDPEILNEIWSE